MGTNETRLGATFFIWTAFTILTVALLVADQFNGVIGVVFALAAVFGTAAVWTATLENSPSKAEAEKAKRQGRIEKFVTQLDEVELDELRARLMAESDGERVSLDELLSEVETRREKL